MWVVKTIVYSKQFMYPILDWFINTWIWSVYVNINSSIFLKKFSFHTFSEDHIGYEPDSDQIFYSNVWE